MPLKYSNGICGVEINAAAMRSIIIVMGLFRFYKATKCTQTSLNFAANRSHSTAFSIAVVAGCLVSLLVKKSVKWETC